MKCFFHFAVLGSLYLSIGCAFIDAAETSPPSKPKGQVELKVVELAVYPATIPRPAMKYHLLPRLVDQTPGNAALLYDTIFIRIAEEDGIREGLTRNLKDEKDRQKYSTNVDQLSEWLNKPVGELPQEEIRKILNKVEPWCLEYAEMASRRMQCEWELPLHEINDPIAIHLPELHKARSLARILAMKARLSLAEGKPEEALKTLQTGLALSRQMASGNVTIIHCLVGYSMANMMRDQLVELTQLKDAPNLYWSISNLPHPLISIRDAVQGEDCEFKRYFCEMLEARTGQHSPEQWQKLLEKTAQKIKYATALISNQDPKTTSTEEVDVQKILDEYYPKARDYLLELGWAEKDIQAMAPARAVLLFGDEVWDEMHDDGMKWLGVPYSEWPSDLRDHYSDLLKKYEHLPMVEGVQVMGKIAATQARCERDFDSLRCIEAIRFYAFSHGGKLPGSLEDIKEVPIPQNPMTGKSFTYRLEGHIAVLLADGDLMNNYEYRIKIAK